MNLFEHLKQVKLVTLTLFGFDISITNGVLVAFIAAALVLIFFYFAGRRAQLKPSLLQTTAEFLVQFINDEMLAPLGKDAGRWLPFITAIFCYVLFCNLLGLIPGVVPPTSNVNFTGTLAVIVFFTVQITGVVKKGPLGYLGSLIPPGIPVFLAPFIFPIELVGQIARPFSLAVRLFANMFAGHAIILTLIGLIFIFRSYLVIPFPVVGNVAILAFELFVSFIQAFIFAFLSASYIIGAVSAEH
ncbi:MAG TPA: F0F1 ATP synthase subunit A [Candidatus Omnitrophota bacterium]|nr:F0F1 ATP synthase subunit A [Candidatus Omnitrophota bacterium]